MAETSREELDALFDRTASLAARPRTVRELPGGLTNRNYKVTTPDGTFVVRLSSGGSELLAIDRDCEYRNSVTAAAAGAGAPVIEYRPADRMLIIGYLEGRTLGPADVAAAENIPRIAQACRRLHAGGRFGNDFDMFDVQRRYRSVARSRGFRDPGRLRRPAAPAGPGPPGPGRPRRGHGPVPQRPAGGQLHRRRRKDLADRLRAVRQQRRLLRARQHRGRIAPARRSPGRARHRLLRKAATEQGRPGPAARPGRHVRVDVVGRDPARREPDRLRLLVLGHGTVRGRRPRLHGLQLPRPARGGPAR